MAEAARPFSAVHVDFGTGDGKFARRLAEQRPELLVIGVDANADGLVEVSRKAPANALFGRLSLDDAPGALEGLAATVSVLLPWGSLLKAVASGDVEKLTRIGPSLRLVYGFGATDGLELPDPAAVWGSRARELTLDEVRALPTTWAKKLAFSGHARRFFEVK